MSFRPCPPSVFQSRHDPDDPRFADLSHIAPALDTPEALAAFLKRAPAENSNGASRPFVIAGYPDDEGIRINGGRPGAALAPDAVRTPLYKMTPALLKNKDDFALYDIGNLDIAGSSIEERHRTVTQFAGTALHNGAQWLGIGGGHDYGFADAQALIEWTKATGSPKPLVINFDAHLDVRPMHRGCSSGTPFYRMLDAYSQDLDFAEIGIQSHCNSRGHLEWARSKGAKILTQDEVEASGEPFSSLVAALLGDWILRPRPAYLSIDIDGFSSSVAPGCSQSWATGFRPDEFFPCLDILLKRLDVKILGLYEVSPPLDLDNRTAKLAAQIAHRFIA